MVARRGGYVRWPKGAAGELSVQPAPQVNRPHMGRRTVEEVVIYPGRD